MRTSALAGWLAVTLCCSGAAWPLAARAELVTDEGAVVIYRAAEEFTAVKENIEAAIVNRGMIVSNTLHVSEMLNRTGADLGFTPPIYAQAESLEFCSALMSHRMTQVHPANLTVCPFTIAIYSKNDAPEQVYVAFRKQSLNGEAQTVTAAIHEMLHGIVKEALNE